MDLSERRGGASRRHPWESARALAIESIVSGLAMRHPRVLDVGCGDGYLVRTLHERLRFGDVVAQDIHLTAGLIEELRQPRINFVRELRGSDFSADLILLLDVLEHVEDPVRLLSELASGHLAPGGRFVITVPAFQCLYGEHDRALQHVKRYTRRGIAAEAQRAGLDVLDSGYLFASLLVPRALSLLGERLRSEQASEQGVGAWRGSALTTRLLHGALALDNRACLAASRRGLTLPGLTAWMTCKAA
jgi:SAM-dependent methyltransferase